MIPTLFKCDRHVFDGLASFVSMITLCYRGYTRDHDPVLSIISYCKIRAQAATHFLNLRPIYRYSELVYKCTVCIFFYSYRCMQKINRVSSIILDLMLCSFLSKSVAGNERNNRPGMVVFIFLMRT